jgi:dTMP kinase
VNEGGKYLVFCGIGGCGKDEQCGRTEKYLLGLGRDVLVTREHTRDTPPGALIEEIIKKRQQQIDPLALQLLYTSDRRNHDMTIIRPNIELGKVVLGNRSYPTTVAYCPPEWRRVILELNQAVVTRPDLVMVIDVDPVIAAKRVEGRGDADIFDTAKRLEKCRTGYEWYRDNSGDPCAWIDGSGTKEEVFKRVLNEIKVRGLLK